MFEAAIQYITPSIDSCLFCSKGKHISSALVLGCHENLKLSGIGKTVNEKSDGKLLQLLEL